MSLHIFTANEIFIANKMFVANKIGGIKDSDKLIEKFIKSKTKKLSKF